MNKSFYTIFGSGILLLGVIGFLLYKYWLISVAVIGGFLVYLIIDKILEILERKKINGVLAYLLIGLFFSITVLAGILFIAIPLIGQLEALTGQLPDLLSDVNQMILNLQKNLPFVLPLSEAVKEKAVSSLKLLLSHSGSMLASIFTVSLMAITLLASRKTLKQRVLEKIPNDYFEVIVSVGHNIVSSIQKFVFAKSLETIIITAIYGFGFWAIGLPLPLLLAIVGGMLNLIPYLGPLLTVVPVILIALIQDNYALLGLGVLIVLIARVIDDAILQTYLIGHFVDVHPFMVVLITLVGGELMGVIGLVIAIPLYVISKTVILGLYEYLRAVQRHEVYLKEEERQNKHNSREEEHNVHSQVF